MHELNLLEWAVRPLKRYADFKGRAPRAEFWWYNLLTSVLGILLSWVERALGSNGVVGAIVNIGLFLPSLAVIVRRLHDTNRGGGWLAVLLASAIVASSCALLIPGGNAVRYTMFTIMALVMVGVVGTFFAFMVLPGTKGSNRYGADPYGPDSLAEVFA